MNSTPDSTEQEQEQAAAAPVREPLTLADFDARIRRYNSDLPKDSTAYKAAVILLAGHEYGQNVDRISRRTGYLRPMVAQVARRLTDNGVWNAGVTVADWTSSETASGTFWNDVAVAEGKMCRRIGPNGQIEWAPAGFWNKSFQFVDPDAEKSLSTLYHDAGPESLETVEPADLVEPDPSAEPMLIGVPTGDPLHEEIGAGGLAFIGANDGSNGHREVDETEIVGPAPARPAVLPAMDKGRATVPALDDLFANVVWIG